MRQFMFVGLAGLIALSVASCASDSGNVATSPSPTTSAAAQKPVTSQPFGTKTAPLVAQKPPAGETIPGLIQSTNGDERAKQVQADIDAQKGKGQEQKDPFAGLPPKLQQPRTNANRQNVPSVNQLPTSPLPVSRSPASPIARSPRLQPPTTTASNPKTPLPPGRQLPRLPTQSTTTKPRSTTTALNPKPTVSPQVPVIKTLPPLPSTTLANAVEVSGVVIVGNVVQAIVKAPNEDTSRYVQAGQRLANGQVLVKRIEINNGSDPIVILEENGVEVAKAIGAVAPTVKPV